MIARVSVLTVALMAWPSFAHGQGNAKELARDRTKQANAAYDLGDYEKAARLYEDAYTAVQDEALLYNIGQAYRMAGRTDKALTAYRSYLRKAPADAPKRAQVESRVEELEKIAAKTREEQAAPPRETLPTATARSEPEAEAQSVPAPQVPSERRGWNFGIGLGVGSLRADCTDCGDALEAGGLFGHVGWMYRPNLAFLVDVWGMAHTEGLLTVQQTLVVAAVRYWMWPRIWFEGGLGVASAGYNWNGTLGSRTDRTANSPGIALAGGYEILIRRAWALDAQIRYGTGFYSGETLDGYAIEAHSFSLGAAINWY